MRMRKRPWAESELSANPFVITDGSGFVNWRESFRNNNPLYVEIGMGKGGFITKSALINPLINFIGVERQMSVCATAARKLIKSGLTNVRIIYGDAFKLTEYFNNDDIDRLFINFCDPWPKTRHVKRRLTYRDCLAIYKTILKSGGLIILKTDNEQLFHFSYDEFIAAGFSIKHFTTNLHADMESVAILKDNVMTEYEQRFSEIGVNIYCIVAENA